MVIDKDLVAARHSLSSGQWADARERLAAVLAAGESADALADMGRALWWLGEVHESLDYRERAFARYRAEARQGEASMLALDISVCYLTSLENDAAARGWIARAQRAATASDDDRMSGWIWLMNGYTSGDATQQQELLGRALDFARDIGDVDLELVALADLGLAHVASGAVHVGLGMLDEAMAGALGGEYQRLETVVWTSCSMLSACSLVGDVTRAAQWCGAADLFMERFGCPFLQARCRSHYGRVLVATGDWELAESELGQALTMGQVTGRSPRAEALVGLAELRLRQGRVEQAEALLVEVGDESDAAVVMSQVLVARGHPDRAVAVLTAQLEGRAEQDAEYPSLAAALVEAYVAAGDVMSAVQRSRSLERVSSGHQHPQARALAARAAGLVAERSGQGAEAGPRLRSAAAGFEALGLPFEAARTRLDLAGVLVASDPALAVVEAGRALERLGRLGATADVARAAALLRSLGVATRPGPRHLGTLSQREREVLRLVEEGLTNPQIAARLFIGPRTAAHHVSSILAKLGVSTRAEAAAFAGRELTRVARSGA